MWGTSGALNEYLEGLLKQALDELAGLQPDVILSEHADVLVANLVVKHLPTPVEVDWETPTRTPVMEVETEERDRFFEDRTFLVPASKVVVSFPVTGTSKMLDYQASIFTWGGNHGKVVGNRVEVEVIARDLDAEIVRGEIDRVRGSVQERATWANEDLAKFLVRADRALREAYAGRKARILNDRQVEDALGIPVQPSSHARPPVPAQRSLVSLQTRVAQSGFVPEPVLEDAIYEDVLQAVRAWATSLERTPATAAKLDEEELRDLLLGTLNGYWQGAAGGELFNGSGKTDILIRHNDRNAFIGECKVWRGPKTVADALDQLFGYLVWRDSKAALLMFIKTKDPAATIDALHDAVAAHPAHLLTKNAVNRASRGDYMMTADAEGRRIALAVVPVFIRGSGSSTA